MYDKYDAYYNFRFYLHSYCIASLGRFMNQIYAYTWKISWYQTEVSFYDELSKCTAVYSPS